MKYFYITFLLLSFSAVAQTPCVNGMAGPYPCNGYTLQSTINLNQLNASDGNDSWGWTDPQNNKEYAIMGLDNGTAFIDISNPTAPIYLGKLPTHTNNSTWRDIKVYQNYAFIVSEASNHGMQVFDLTRLRNVPNAPTTFTEDAHYSGFGRAHNIVINTESGYAYGVGTSTYNGGPHFVNIQDPLNPVAAGGYSMDNYSHDAQVVTYCGPDQEYVGREILIGSNEEEVVIVDITDKNNPQNIASTAYPNVGYTHQGWFTEDQRYFILGDEVDELDFGGPTRTIIFDFEDLDNPELSFVYEGATTAIDHNGYVKGNKFYLANYTAGMRVLDISQIENGIITEEGFFDSRPTNNNTNFNGAWNVYPYFASGNIVISDINAGFLLVKSPVADTTPPTAVCGTATIALDENGVAVLEASAINNGSTDNSGNINFLICQDTFDCSDVGTFSVTLEVYDDFGNFDTCTAMVTVVDTIAPQLTCPEDTVVTYQEGGMYTLPDYITNGTFTVTDNCIDSLSTIQDPAAGTQLTDGLYTIEFTTTDAEGNTYTCSFNLQVNEVLSVEEQEASAFILYPNPATNSVSIQSASQAIQEVVLYDMAGKLIYSEKDLDLSIKKLDISAFSKGVYFITINNTLTKKIIKL